MNGDFKGKLRKVGSLDTFGGPPATCSSEKSASLGQGIRNGATERKQAQGTADSDSSLLASWYVII